MSNCPNCLAARLSGADRCPRCGRSSIDTPLSQDAEALELFSLSPPSDRAAATLSSPSAMTLNDPAGIGSLSAATLNDPALSAPAPATVSDLSAHTPPTPDAAPPLFVRPRLVVVRGDRLGVEYPLLEGKNVIGRSADQPVDIDLEGQEPADRTWTSRVHAVVTLGLLGLMLEDQHSLNGTFVNRHRVQPGLAVALQPGDVIQVGTVQLRVTVG